MLNMKNSLLCLIFDAFRNISKSSNTQGIKSQNINPYKKLNSQKEKNEILKKKNEILKKKNEIWKHK